MTTLTEHDEDVRLAVMRWFADEGRAPAPNELAAALGRPQADVEASLHRLAENRLLVLAPGTPYVWMANQFSAIPTPFEVRSGERRWWGNCVWDGLAILAAVRRDGEVRTMCPDCSEPLALRVEGGEVAGDLEAVVHFGVPAANWWDDIGFN